MTYDILRSSGTLEVGDALPELLTEGFDDEQIWQELELQNLPAIDRIVKDISVLKKIDVSFQKDTGKDDSDEDEVETDAEQDEDMLSDGSNISNAEDVSLGLEQTKRLNVDDNSDSESEEEKELKKLLDEATSLGEENGNESSEDEGDLFGSDLENEETSIRKTKRKGEEIRGTESMTSRDSKKAHRRKTVVDDKFFNIADLETFLEREDAKEEKRRKKESGNESENSESDEEDDEEVIDFFADIPSDDEVGINFVFPSME